MVRNLLPLAIVAALMALDVTTSTRAADAAAKTRRVLYNLDGDSCMFSKAGSKGPVAITPDDLKQIIAEITEAGSQVDSILICINAQVMYYPTKVGTMRGAISTPAERAAWPPPEKQRSENVARMFAGGDDPYAVLLEETRRRGREALLTFRVNDAHGNDFLRTQFWNEHPECRLDRGALDFADDLARDYVFRLIEEAVRRYDCDGIELDFNRFPTLFKEGSTVDRVAKINDLVERVRKMVDTVGTERGRWLVLAVRVPSNYNRTPPTYEVSREAGCDPAIWAKNGWVDFVTVSEFLFTRYEMPIRSWKERICEVPVYGGIECAEGSKLAEQMTPEKYRRAAHLLQQGGADGIYLFNFFTTRENGPDSSEPPFAVLRDLYTAGGAGR